MPHDVSVKAHNTTAITPVKAPNPINAPMLRLDNPAAPLGSEDGGCTLEDGLLLFCCGLFGLLDGLGLLLFCGRLDGRG